MNSKRSKALALGFTMVAAGCAPNLPWGPGSSSSSSSSSGQAPPPDVELAAPPTGQGFQLKIDGFEVPAGMEIQNCYFFQVPGAGDVFVNKVEIGQNDGSHHMNIFRVKTIKGLDPALGNVFNNNGVGECFKSPNWSDWPLVFNSQQDGVQAWELPSGVAHRFQGGDWIMLQSHYVNASTQRSAQGRGLVKVNFWTAAATTVQHELGTLFATKQNIRICQNNPTPTFGTGCQVRSSTPVRVIGANGHFHSRGKRFDMYRWDGMAAAVTDPTARFYTSESWDDPPMSVSPALDVELPIMGGVYYTCGFEWQPPPAAVGCAGINEYDRTKYGTAESDLDCCYTFGGVVEQSEHCNAFVYYYPKSDDVFCN